MDSGSAALKWSCGAGSTHEIAPVADVVELSVAMLLQHQARQAAAGAAGTTEHDRAVSRQFVQSRTKGIKRNVDGAWSTGLAKFRHGSHVHQGGALGLELGQQSHHSAGAPPLVTKPQGDGGHGPILLKVLHTVEGRVQKPTSSHVSNIMVFIHLHDVRETFESVRHLKRLEGLRMPGGDRCSAEVCLKHEKSKCCMSLVSWIIVFVVVVVATIWGVRWLRRELTPTRLPHPEAEYRWAADWVSISTADGKRLHVQWIPAEAPSTKGVVILMHGWGGNGSQLRAAGHTLWLLGWSVMLPDARCHGLSDDDTYSSLPRFAQDLEACLDWSLGQSQAKAAAGRVFLLGHSLGAAAALLCASRRSEVQAVVSVSSFAHPESVMRRWLADYRIPYWPLGWVFNRYIEWVIGYLFDDIAPEATIARIKAPVLIVHGLQDNVVPLACAQRLQAAAAQANLLAVPGRHDGFDDEAELYRQVAAWMKSQLLDQEIPKPI